MFNVLICGIESEMGMAVFRSILNANDLQIVCGVAKNFSFDFGGNVPVYQSFDEVKEIVDVVIDLSSADMIDDVLNFVLENKCALIEGTHGFSKKQKEQIVNASKTVPVFLSVNASQGVFTTVELCMAAAKQLGHFDIEIIEEHQAEKANSPSTTALLLAQTLNYALGENRKITSGRSGSTARSKNEICIHSVRGGGLSGRTKVMFIGEDETVSIVHTAHNRLMYSKNVDKIVNFISGKPPRIYNLADFFK